MSLYDENTCKHAFVNCEVKINNWKALKTASAATYMCNSTKISILSSSQIIYFNRNHIAKHFQLILY